MFMKIPAVYIIRFCVLRSCILNRERSHVMITDTFVLDSRYPDCTLTTYIHDVLPELQIEKRRAIIVCPGGGYQFLSDREGEPVALQYFAAGLNVFLLKYSISDKAVNSAPLIEAALAMLHIRNNAQAYHIDPDYVFITGFSAGGHLAASLCTMWKDEAVANAIGGELSILKPTAGVLCYPVITGGPFAHRGSIDTLCGYDSLGTEGAMHWSLENRVDSDTSPAFIWHTFNDTCVPIQNTILYITAMAKYGIPFEYHVYPDGVHGLALCNKETWTNNPILDNHVCVSWLDESVRYLLEFKK